MSETDQDIARSVAVLFQPGLLAALIIRQLKKRTFNGLHSRGNKLNTHFTHDHMFNNLNTCVRSIPSADGNTRSEMISIKIIPPKNTYKHLLDFTQCSLLPKELWQSPIDIITGWCLSLQCRLHLTLTPTSDYFHRLQTHIHTHAQTDPNLQAGTSHPFQGTLPLHSPELLRDTHQVTCPVACTIFTVLHNKEWPTSYKPLLNYSTKLAITEPLHTKLFSSECWRVLSLNSQVYKMVSSPLKKKKKIS